MVMDLLKDAQDKALGAIEQANGLAVQAVRQGISTIEGYIPDLSWLPIPATAPQPKELVDNGFDFAQKLLKAQRAYVNDLLKAVAPVTKAVYGKPATPAAAKAA